MGFLDEAGLAHLWDKIKNVVTDYRVVMLNGDAVPSVKYPGYGFEHTVEWDSVESDMWVDGAVIAGEYNGSWAIDSSDGSVTLYFATNPTATFGLIAGMEMSTVVAVTNYNTAIHMNEIGTVPDTTIIRQLYENFQNGCSIIADTVTELGVATAATASPNVIADNIRTLVENKFDGDGTITQVYDYHTVGDPDRNYDTITVEVGTAPWAIISISNGGGNNVAYSGIQSVTSTTGTVSLIRYDSKSVTSTTDSNYTSGTGLSTYLITEAVNAQATITYRGPLVVHVLNPFSNVAPYNLYIISVSGSCAKTATGTYDGTHSAYVNGGLSGSVWLKIKGTEISVYSNSTKITGDSVGQGSQLSKSPISAKISNVNMTSQTEGTFTLTVSGSGSAEANSSYGTQVSVTDTINCTITGGNMTISASGTITAHSNFWNLNASGTTGASVSKRR